MSNSKPVINFITTNSRNDYSNRNYKGSAYINKRYDTYRVKTYQRTFGYMYRNTRNSLSYKESEWGEWFEHWVLDDGKPVISNQGWN
jgi:hypothetical protein